eukprot:COSAG01_NODE_19702_length_994_cov_6.045746_1_plen_21_part_10
MLMTRSRYNLGVVHKVPSVAL